MTIHRACRAAILDGEAPCSLCETEYDAFLRENGMAGDGDDGDDDEDVREHTIVEELTLLPQELLREHGI